MQDRDLRARSRDAAAVKITCTGGPRRVTLKLTARGRHHHRVDVATKTVTLAGGETRVVRISLSGAAKHLLTLRHVLAAKLLVSQAPSTTVSTQTLAFKAHVHRHHH